MKKNTFKSLILDFQDKDLSHVVPRDIRIPLDIDKTISLVGVRRSGKTFILYSLIHELKKTLDKRNILYINFEDDRLYPLELSDLNLLIETYYELFPMKKKEKVFLFLDEIQNVPNWELFVRRIQDTENCRLFITGSSAKLLGKELATALRGRSLTYEVFPLSFNEYLKFKNLDKDNYSSYTVAKIKSAFDEYLLRGGFPEVFDYNEDVYTRTLQEYLELLMYRDIVERFNIKNIQLLKSLMKFCFVNIAKLMSPNKLYNDFRSRGLKLSKNTIYEYLGHLEDAYGVFSMPIYSQSVSEELRNPKKIYSVDTGFKRVMDYSFKKDTGYLYENIVFTELRREMREIFYYKRKQEVDFCFKRDGRIELINVTYVMDDPSTRKREITGLVEAMEYFSIDEGLLLTAETEEEIRVENKRVKVVPLWKWLLYR
ncbi:MAG: ATP-binding protein [bacterium]|nr:ATP-binding protein [bacterium]